MTAGKKLVKSLAVNPRAALPLAKAVWKVRPRARGFPWAAPTWPGSVPRPPDVSDTGMDYDTAWARKYPARLARAVVLDNLTRPLVKAIASPTLEGDERIEGLQGPVIFAANHASHADTPLLLSSLPSRFRHRMVVAAGADYFFDKRWKGHLVAFSINAVPIERLKVSRRSADLPMSLLEDGWSLLIYPEGGRTPDGWAKEHRGGAAYLATRVHVPVVPLYVSGTRKVLERGRKLPARASTRVSFGRPMHARDGEDARKFAARIEAEIEALADEQTGGLWEARRRAATGSSPSLRGPQGAADWRRSWDLGEGRRKPKGGPVWPAR